MTTCDPKSPARGVGVTLWNGSNLRRVLTPGMRSLLAECVPDIVCVHAGPDRLAGAAAKIVAEVRRIMPHARFHLGVGWDYWVGAAIAGRVSYVRAVKELADTGDLAAALGCEAVIHDAEAACKADSLITSQIAREVIGAIRAEHPQLIQGHTAYDHPTLHSDDRDGVYDDESRREYAWRAFCGDGAADWAVPQIYCAQGDAFASRGALRRRLETHRASWAKAIDLGWIRRDLPVDAYHQAHHVPFAQTCTVGAEHDLVLLWCGPEIAAGGRMDESGAWALRGLCAMERARIRAPGGIAAFQRARGLAADGIAGRLTLAALGVQVPAVR